MTMQPTGGAGLGQARAWLRAPDVLTAARLPLAAAFVMLEDPIQRLWVLVAAAGSDFVDGMWARRIGGSRIGAVLDPICDKAFVGAAFGTVLASGRLALLELIGVLLRDVLAVVGFLVTWGLRRPTTMPARAGGKAVTVCQFLTLAAFVAGSDVLRPMAWATAAISVYAVADYARVVWRQ